MTLQDDKVSVYCLLPPAQKSHHLSSNFAKGRVTFPLFTYVVEVSSFLHAV